MLTVAVAPVVAAAVAVVDATALAILVAAVVADAAWLIYCLLLRQWLQ